MDEALKDLHHFKKVVDDELVYDKDPVMRAECVIAFLLCWWKKIATNSKEKYAARKIKFAGFNFCCQKMGMKLIPVFARQSVNFQLLRT